MAALDDDHHLIFNDHPTPVCEKTARIYSLPAFVNLVKCTDGRPELLEKLNDVPEVFNYDTFEEDQERLFKLLYDAEKNEDRVSLFYPGPFRLLILNDGSVVKRGQLTMVPKSFMEQLIKRDGLFKIENLKCSEPLFFQELYSSSGASCLLENDFENDLPERERETDFTKLNRISREMKERLLNLIRNNKKYFILTGSDSGDKLGCCPSEVVTEANRLENAGILDAYRQPGADESCPVTIYAFRNEIKTSDNDLQFNIDNDFRQLILQKLQSKTDYHFRDFTRWILLAFIAVTVMLALFRFFKSTSPPEI